ncbi:Putative protein [Zobellia galactanivorans]|uniref:Uncharacterized protein n=1 Tax=Zobellia galactanivorans (strain DSM 12802 / CCUG 47099 / CIP 106680 / NCIMB 13871 / Dsij) TaxID=63186 RepID=G0L948_ZOBGA|nr:Putative protein [Zobellia galactanivorans]
MPHIRYNALWDSKKIKTRVLPEFWYFQRVLKDGLFTPIPRDYCL